MKENYTPKQNKASVKNLTLSNSVKVFISTSEFAMNSADVAVANNIDSA
jgi:hypothetical protein